MFKIIPILNPDGVARGYYRLDTRGVNLNRLYLTPSATEHPSIYAIKKAALQQDLFMFVDFHAHASKKAGFMFGNYFKDPVRQTNNIAFAKLIAMNCLNFDIAECNFSDKIMV